MFGHSKKVLDRYLKMWYYNKEVKRLTVARTLKKLQKNIDKH